MPLAALLLLLIQSDSADRVRSARRAQTEFERLRLAALPRGVSRASGRCDVRVGRYCYWSDDPRGDLPPEPARIGVARDRLLAVLDSAAAAAPGDPWVAGQRVRYLLEAGRLDAAREAARRCRAEAWWCTALAALAQHVAGNVPTAERLFDGALDAMPADMRCRWIDLSDLLDDRLRARYRRLSCDARTGFNARVWWLAQPLWSTAGNDRRTEHYARLTMARLWEHARSLYGFWGADQRELLVRYGWPVAWERDDGGGVRDPTAIGHEPEPSYHFVPEAAAFDGPGAEDAADLRDARAAERYAPGYDAFTTLAVSFAEFRRGESTLVVASYDVTDDTLFAGTAREAVLVLARDPATPFVAVRRHGAPASGVLVAEAPWSGGRVSLELEAPERRAAGRARRQVSRPVNGTVSLTGIALFDPGDALPRTLGEVLERVHVGSVRQGARIGLYWEVYGLAAGAAVPTAVHVTADHVPWVRRVASVLHLAARPREARIAWEEVSQPVDGRVVRALVLDLTGLDPGRYRIDVTVSPPDGGSVGGTRLVRVVAP